MLACYLQVEYKHTQSKTDYPHGFQELSFLGIIIRRSENSTGPNYRFAVGYLVSHNSILLLTILQCEVRSTSLTVSELVKGASLSSNERFSVRRRGWDSNPRVLADIGLASRHHTGLGYPGARRTYRISLCVLGCEVLSSRRICLQSTNHPSLFVLSPTNI